MENKTFVFEIEPSTSTGRKRGGMSSSSRFCLWAQLKALDDLGIESILASSSARDAFNWWILINAQLKSKSYSEFDLASGALMFAIK